MSSPDSAPSDINWDQLRQVALEMTKRAYAPYSNFSVGAAAITTTGSIVSGTNVENVSYGLTLCAECGLVSDLVAHSAGKLVAVVVVSGSGEHCAPCGRCRQLLVEHAAPHALINTAEGPRPVVDLLPGHFDVSRLKDG
ncbi:MAG: cytidine deaminase [Acidimicrobiales bacterium]|nr:cytidine deaminase [Acidimicrobiales bacterium]